MAIFLLIYVPCIIVFIILVIAALRFIYVIDPIFIAIESIFFLLLAMRPYDNWFFGHAFIDPGDEAAFTPWYQKLITSLSAFVEKNGWSRGKCILVVCVTVAIITAIVIFLEFGLRRFKFGIILNICIKYSIAIIASLLIAENARFLTKLGGSPYDKLELFIFILLFLGALAVHLIILIVIDRKQLGDLLTIRKLQRIKERENRLS